MDDRQMIIWIQVQEIMVEVEAMKAENERSRFMSGEPTYSEDCFNQRAQELSELAHEIKQR